MESHSLFSDILNVTKMTFDEMKASPLAIRKILYYDLYRALHTMNYELYVTLEHYLALTFEEPFLTETTSFRSGVDKWRTFLNKDFASATLHIQAFLGQLQHLSYDDDDDESMGAGILQRGPLEKYIEHKNFYAAMSHYNAGVIAPDSLMLEQTSINIPMVANEPLIKRVVDLSTYEKRLCVKNEGWETLRALIDYEDIIKQELHDSITIDDLLLEREF